MIGDSILYWAGRRAVNRGMANLKLPGNLSLGWKCVRGMRWADLHHCVQRELLFNSKYPKVILIHLGGNDLDTSSLFKLKRVINREIEYIYNTCSSTILVWCDIVQRRVWRGAGEKVNEVMERKRRRVNGFGRKSVMANDRGRYFSAEIDYTTSGFYRPDGVHLSDVGLEMFLDNIRECLLRVLG